jgi:hypothetical protein
MHDLDILGLLRKYEPFDDLKIQAADEIEYLRNELADAVDSVYGMVVQYCEDHRYKILDSGFLGFPADAMRLLDAYGLLEDFSDHGPRYVSAAVPNDAQYKLVEERIQMIRTGQITTKEATSD